MASFQMHTDGSSTAARSYVLIDDTHIQVRFSWDFDDQRRQILQSIPCESIANVREVDLSDGLTRTGIYEVSEVLGMDAAWCALTSTSQTIAIEFQIPITIRLIFRIDTQHSAPCCIGRSNTIDVRTLFISLDEPTRFVETLQRQIALAEPAYIGATRVLTW